VEGLICKALQIQYEHGSERYFLLFNQSLLACALTQIIVGTVLALIGSLTKAGEFLKRVEKNLLTMIFKTKLCEAYKALANYYRARSNNHRARDYLLLLKEVDPLCEQAHRLLI
jgi:hypothetical protein